MAARFAVIDEVADRAQLSDRCLKKIDKARRVTKDMVATIGFVPTEIAVRLTDLDVSQEVRANLATKWIPGLYLYRVAARAKLAEDRYTLIATGEQLLAPLREAEHPLQQVDAELAAQIDGMAMLCAGSFQ